MLSEEEKRAIDFLKGVCTDDCVNKEFVVKPILYLIEKQQKELEQEKEKNKDLQKQLNGAFDRGFISKDKLKSFFQDKIIYRQFELQQEYKDFKDDIKLNTLQNLKEELLEEK